MARRSAPGCSWVQAAEPRRQVPETLKVLVVPEQAESLEVLVPMCRLGDITNTCLGNRTQVWKPIDPMDLVSSHSFL